MCLQQRLSALGPNDGGTKIMIVSEVPKFSSFLNKALHDDLGKLTYLEVISEAFNFITAGDIIKA